MTVAQLKKRMDNRFTHLQRRMNARFSAVDLRFDAMDRRFDEIGRTHDTRFASVERHLLSLGEKLDSIGRRLEDQRKTHWKILNEHEDQLKDLEAAERARRPATD